MKLGEIRRIDENGRMQIPKDIRRVFDIDTDTELNVYVEEDKIIIKRIGDSK